MPSPLVQKDWSPKTSSFQDRLSLAWEGLLSSGTDTNLVSDMLKQSPDGTGSCWVEVQSYILYSTLSVSSSFWSLSFVGRWDDLNKGRRTETRKAWLHDSHWPLKSRWSVSVFSTWICVNTCEHVVSPVACHLGTAFQVTLTLQWWGWSQTLEVSIQKNNTFLPKKYSVLE